jgi:hypothetical protein
MNSTLTIDAFHAQLASSSEENPLLKAVRSLMTLDKEELMSLVESLAGWAGWPT